MSTYVKQVTNKFQTEPYQTTEKTEVTPSVESKSTSLSMPTDPALQQELQRQIQAAQRAYGVNPQTGAVTPFEALGYNPEEERKRREAERALNDRKRKENAWYNAFAVLGDSLTAALGGNVWQRQPNNIGVQANADNARLIAEQKAEDEANAAKLRAAGLGYANTVNQLLQNYLTKTTNTTTTGGSRIKTTDHPAVTGSRQASHTVGSSGGGGRGGGSGRRSHSSSTNSITPTNAIQVMHNGKPRTYYIPSNVWEDTVIKLYNNLLRNGLIDPVNIPDGKLTFADMELLTRGTIDELENNGGKSKFGYDWSKIRGSVLAPLGSAVNQKGGRVVNGWMENYDEDTAPYLVENDEDIAPYL